MLICSVLGQYDYLLFPALAQVCLHLHVFWKNDPEKHVICVTSITLFWIERFLEKYKSWVTYHFVTTVTILVILWKVWYVVCIDKEGMWGLTQCCNIILLTCHENIKLW